MYKHAYTLFLTIRSKSLKVISEYLVGIFLKGYK